MKRTLTLAAAVLTLTGCAAVRDLMPQRDANPYTEPPFYAKYLNTGSPLDERINLTLERLQQEPGSAQLHNDLGTLLVEKGFPKDAEQEFERAIRADRRHHPAWYNLGLVRAARGDESGARRAFRKTVDLKPGHAAALFQLGLIEEKSQHVGRAVAYYAKAYRINPALLEVEVNPRILDSKLTDRALLTLYPAAHTRQSMQFQDAPVISRPKLAPPAAPSPQPAPVQIVPPAPPVTEPSMQQAPSTAPSASAADQGEVEQPRRRRSRPRRPTAAPPPAGTETEAPVLGVPQPEAETQPPIEIPADEVPQESPEGTQETPPEEPPPPPPGR